MGYLDNAGLERLWSKIKSALARKQDAASAFTQSQADGRYLKLSGGDLSGMLDMNNHTLTGIPAPVGPADAVNYQTMMDTILKLMSSTTAVAKSIYGDYEFTVKLEKTATVGALTVFKLSGSADLPYRDKGYNQIIIYYPPGFSRPGAEWSETGYEFPKVSEGSVYDYLSPNYLNIDGYATNTIQTFYETITFSGYMPVKAE